MIIAIVLFLVGCDAMDDCRERVQLLSVGNNGWASCCPGQKMGLQIVEGPGAQRSLMITCTSSEIDNQVSPTSSMETH